MHHRRRPRNLAEVLDHLSSALADGPLIPCHASSATYWTTGSLCVNALYGDIGHAVAASHAVAWGRLHSALQRRPLHGYTRLSIEFVNAKPVRGIQRPLRFKLHQVAHTEQNWRSLMDALSKLWTLNYSKREIDRTRLHAESSCS